MVRLAMMGSVWKAWSLDECTFWRCPIGYIMVKEVNYDCMYGLVKHERKRFNVSTLEY